MGNYLLHDRERSRERNNEDSGALVRGRRKVTDEYRSPPPDSRYSKRYQDVSQPLQQRAIAENFSGGRERRYDALFFEGDPDLQHGSGRLWYAQRPPTSSLASNWGFPDTSGGTDPGSCRQLLVVVKILIFFSFSSTGYQGLYLLQTLEAWFSTMGMLLMFMSLRK